MEATEQTEETPEVYESPVVTEAGDFAEVTAGSIFGFQYDGGFYPYSQYG
ncbi:lasso RiPP family leader peptide-containing protein [Streptomyces sp. LZ34]